MGEVIDMGVEFGIIQKSGSWFSYGSDKLGQGRDSVRQLLHDNPELAAEMEAKDPREDQRNPGRRGTGEIRRDLNTWVGKYRLSKNSFFCAL